MCYNARDVTNALNTRDVTRALMGRGAYSYIFVLPDEFLLKSAVISIRVVSKTEREHIPPPPPHLTL